MLLSLRQGVRRQIQHTYVIRTLQHKDTSDISCLPFALQRTKRLCYTQPSGRRSMGISWCIILQLALSVNEGQRGGSFWNASHILDSNYNNQKVWWLTFIVDLVEFRTFWMINLRAWPTEERSPLLLIWWDLGLNKVGEGECERNTSVQHSACDCRCDVSTLHIIVHTDGPCPPNQWADQPSLSSLLAAGVFVTASRK